MKYSFSVLNNSKFIFRDSKGIQDIRPEIKNWLDSNCHYDLENYLDTEWMNHIGYIIFKSSEDEALFKMRWL